MASDPRLSSDQVIIRDYYVVFWRSDSDDVGPFVINNAFNYKSDEQRLFSHIYENKDIYAPVRCVKDE